MEQKIINEILDKLEETYPEAECALRHEDVFQLIISVVLSAQATDKSVNRATPALFEAYPDAFALGDADPEEVSGYIRNIGMYRTKSRYIVGLSKILAEKYGGEVPDDYGKLIELPGVGRKSANIVLSSGFGHQRIAVDTHVFRVSNRIGLAQEGDVLKTELSLMKSIPEERWSKAHHLLIFHGREQCRARKPDCGSCCVKDLCERHL